VLADLNLNARQQEAVAFVKRSRRIANSEYQQLTGANRKTAARGLDELVTKGVFKRVGEKRGSYYLLTGQK
jgi:predicted HTH transcriptional regulator